MAAGSTINLVLSIFGISVSSVFIIFWCARFFCSQIINGRHPPGTLFARMTFNGRVVERTMTGVNPLVISTFPTVNFTQNSLAFRQELLCAICLGEYKEGEILRILPQCIHMFHVNCIDAWLHQHSTCPVCRMSLQDVVSSVPESGTDERISSEQLTNLLEMPPALSTFACEGDDVENLTNLVHSVGHNVSTPSLDTISTSQLRMEGVSSSEHLNSDISDMHPAVINCMNKKARYVNLQATLGVDQPSGLALQLEKHVLLEDFADTSGINNKESHVVDLEPPE